jgi:DNA polymerase
MNQIKKLHKYFDKLQLKYGCPSLDSIYGAGCIKNPEIFFVFMNPTMKNIASSKNWCGLKAQWIGTKNIWNFFTKIDLFDDEINEQIQRKKPEEWSPEFAREVYKNVCDSKIYITNLSKATQKDARHLKNCIFQEYLPFLKEEIMIINPKKIITFGNQVSSILLNENIKISQCRKKEYILNVKNKEYRVFPIYYPVGQGMRNISKAIEDLKWILKRK